MTSRLVQQRHAHLRHAQVRIMEGGATVTEDPSPESVGGDYGFSQLKAPGNPGDTTQLQDSIYRAFDETENLLDRLRDAPQPSEPTANRDTKKPKDDKVIIEELEVANCHLRRMVDSLFVELDHCQRENLELRKRIQQLEDQMVGRVDAEPTFERRGNEGVGVENRPELEMIHLPPLAPLDVPKFDFK